MTKKLQFVFSPVRHDDGSGSDHWIAGIYKITKYESIAAGTYARTAFYRGYFKPTGWKNWGKAIDAEQHRTLTSAKRACQRHAEMFPGPSEYDRL